MKTTSITIRISDEDKELLRKQADAAHRSMSNYIIYLIQKEAEQNEVSRPASNKKSN